MIRWFRNWLWVRRNLRLGSGTRIAMEAGRRMHEKNGVAPGLLRTVKLSIENEKRCSTQTN